MDKCPECGNELSWDTAGNEWCDECGWGDPTNDEYPEGGWAGGVD